MAFDRRSSTQVAEEGFAHAREKAYGRRLGVVRVMGWLSQNTNTALAAALSGRESRGSLVVKAKGGRSGTSASRTVGATG